MLNAYHAACRFFGLRTSVCAHAWERRDHPGWRLFVMLLTEAHCRASAEWWRER